MRVNSLSFRLLTSSALIAIVLLAAAAFLLNALFQQALERNFDQRLKAALDGILANVELQSDGTPRLQGPIADTRFSLPLSGWYWQVSSTEKNERLLASDSLLEQNIAVPEAAMALRVFLRLTLKASSCG
jgi:Two-component sensor kinase N-terminal